MIINPGPACPNYLHSTESINSAEMHSEPIKNRRMKNNAPIKKESKKVRFFPSVQVRRILHRSNFTAEERTNTWYTKCDIAQRRREEKQTLELLKSGAYQGDCDQHCVRGLESRIRKDALARRQIKEAARLVVLKLQHMQNYEFQNNPEAIAMAYIAVTRHSVMAAYDMAVLDQLYVSGTSLVPTDKVEAKVLTLSKPVPIRTAVVTTLPGVLRPGPGKVRLSNSRTRRLHEWIFLKNRTGKNASFKTAPKQSPSRTLWQRNAASCQDTTWRSRINSTHPTNHQYLHASSRKKP